MTELAKDLQRFAPWSTNLNGAQRERVLSDLKIETVDASALVCGKGEPVDAWIGVVEGLLKLTSSSSEGKTMTFTGVPAGGWFGEGSLMKNEPRRYEAIALRDSRVARLPRATFHWLLDSSIAFNRFLLIQLNERLSQFIGKAEYEQLLDQDAKLARCIGDLFNPVLYPGIGTRLDISQSELALLVGVSRQRLNQSLQVLEREGLIRIEYGGIEVRNLGGLRAYGT